MRDRRERASKSERDERMNEEISTRDPERKRDRERERKNANERENRQAGKRQTRTEGVRDGRTHRVLTKLTGADLRRNLTNSGLNPPTRAVDLSCLPVNLAAVLAGQTRH